MRADDLLAYVRAAPFRPFRIVMNSGRTFEIRHPEMIRVTRSMFLVFYTRPDEPPDAPADHYEMLSLLLIEGVQHIETPTAA